MIFFCAFLKKLVRRVQEEHMKDLGRPDLFGWAASAEVAHNVQKVTCNIRRSITNYDTSIHQYLSLPSSA